MLGCLLWVGSENGGAEEKVLFHRGSLLEGVEKIGRKL
jgi:hypothetical protein